MFVAGESGFEIVGFNTGVCVLGVVVGTVVIGVVMSFCTVDESSWYETLSCSPFSSLFVAINVETEKTYINLNYFKIMNQFSSRFWYEKKIQEI